ncbi:hypothetical protein L810_7579 [Burkholderia sp. AU4i]|nr:hypothetical protein L810_7579 [Burkholderia sp. AU4i]QOH32402.1 hypothetical protein C7S14_4281 [Burkholderia cepacia]
MAGRAGATRERGAWRPAGTGVERTMMSPGGPERRPLGCGFIRLCVT